MKSVQRWCLVLFCLVWSISVTASSVKARADSSAADSKSWKDWDKILTNGRGEGACEIMDKLKNSSACQSNNGTGRTSSRRGLFMRDDSEFKPSNCTCTTPFFNVYCGCLYSTPNRSNECAYQNWTNSCSQSNITTDGVSAWLTDQDVPDWAWTVASSDGFNNLRIEHIASTAGQWTTIQILAPIIASISTILIAGVIFLHWRRNRFQRSKIQVNPSFFAYIRKLFARRAPSVTHKPRNDTWEIDVRQQVVNDSENDDDSFFMVPHPASFVESPDVERSHWSPATASSYNSRQNNRRYSFTPGSRLPAEERMLGTATIRSFGDRVKSLLPWGTRPVPVVSKRPSTGYRIDPDRSTLGTKSRSNTLSTLSTMRKGNGDKYSAIPEVDDQQYDAVQTGRTRAGDAITEEDRQAVANSVLVIGEPDFTMESGSTGHSQQARHTQRATGGPFRGRTATENVESPSANVDVQVEPPSPTLESMRFQSPTRIPVSPGAPPLLPPAPQQRPPLPPATTRTTPRRTPSPHLRISTQFDDNPLTLPNNQDSPNPNSGPTQYTSHTQQHHVGLHHRDPQGSGESASGTHALSYVTLPGGSHRKSQSPSNNYLSTDLSPSSRRRSGSGSNPVSAPSLVHQHSDTSIGQFSILRPPNASNTGGRRLSSGGDATQSAPQLDSQPSDFDPYEASGLPQPLPLQPNRHPDAQQGHPYIHHHHPSSSGSSLPRAPGDSVGQLQRGWSVDDDTDRASLLLDRPLEVDDGMSADRGVYVAAPMNVIAPTAVPAHFRDLSSESITAVTNEYAQGERIGGGTKGENRLSVGASGEGDSPTSPTLSQLESDMRNVARFAGRQSISGSSGWDTSTQITHGSSPIDPTPSVPSRSPRFSPRPLNFNPNMTSNQTFNQNLTSKPGHARVGSESSLLSHSRSRDEILNPARNDPVRLFPTSVRSAGYTTGLAPSSGPTPIPSPARTPRPLPDVNATTSANVTGTGHTPSHSTGNAAVSGVGALAGYVEKSKTQVGGGTWGTESSGAQSILEPVQQLPEPYPRGSPSGDKRTP